MLRARKRPDWPVTVMKFDVYLTSDIPQSFWDTAKNMQKAWNELVDLRESFFNKTPKDATKEEKKLIWTNFVPEAKSILKSDKYGFNWECKQELIDRFNKATTSKQNPKKQFRLKTLNLVRIFGEGGRNINEVFCYQAEQTKEKNAVGLRTVDRFHYASNKFQSRHMRGSRGYFELNSESRVYFNVNLHREIPKEAFLKRVVFKGDHSNLGWKWSIILYLEVPPTKIQSILRSQACGLDLGWRKFDDYLRVGMIATSNGEVKELKLPLTWSNAKSRQRKRKFGQNDPDPIIDNWLAIEVFQSKLDLELEEAKALIRKNLTEKNYPNMPSEIKEKLSSLHVMRERGLFYLIKLLEEKQYAPAIHTSLMVWQIKNQKGQRRIQQAYIRLIKNRRNLYRVYAKELAQYSQIGWESDLSLKQMAEAPLSANAEEAALKNSMKFRQIACLHEFREYIKHATKQTGSVLLVTKTANTTNICCFCEGKIVNQSKLINTCERGHKLDQDVNAAINLLKQSDKTLNLQLFEKYLVGLPDCQLIAV